MNAENIITIIALIIMSATLYLAFSFGFQEKQEIDTMLIKHPECTMAIRPRACLRYNLNVYGFMNKYGYCHLTPINNKQVLESYLRRTFSGLERAILQEFEEMENNNRVEVTND